jgi:hypothetical protein
VMCLLLVRRCTTSVWSSWRRSMGCIKE